ncbi:MAG: type II secretion system protein [Pseudomonadota bacterium]
MIGANCQQGFSLAEVLATLILLSLVIAPALLSLQSAVDTANRDIDLTEQDFVLQARMESVLAESYNTLLAEALGPSTPSSYSDAQGTPNRVTIYVAGYDLDNADADGDRFTGIDDGVLWIRAEIEDTGQRYDSLKGFN